VVFVGTDLGVMASYDGGTTWSDTGLGFPNTAVYWLGYHARSGQLMAATHGRGVWAISFPRKLAVTPAQLAFTSDDLKPQTLSVQNTSHPASLLRVSAKSSAPWLQVPTGELQIGARKPVDLPVTVKPEGLAPGPYTQPFQHGRRLRLG
jgi:hypothetical protein